jgi:MerR family transcriptional regulator, light-induced transcriptional regulator
LKKGVAVLSSITVSVNSTVHDGRAACAVAERDPFLAFILEGNRHEAEAYARRVFEQRGVAFLYEQVVQTALREVGSLWFANRITVADEHLATNTAQSAVAALYPLFSWPPRGPRVLLACAEGERHEFGLRMVADLLALDGWDDRFLGSDVPTEDLARHAAKFAPKVVAMSVTLAWHVPTTQKAIGLVRSALPSAKIVVGGLATEGGGWEALGADAVARSGPQAVEVFRAWR